MNSKIKKWFHGILMPRGKNFVNIKELEVDWHHIDIKDAQKTISTIYKIVDTNRPTIILCHPYLAESRQFFLKRGHAQMYLELNCNVVIFDFNGFGQSPFVDFNYHEDVDMVINHFKGLIQHPSIVCHGVSFGASQTITYTSQPSHLVDKIIIENCLDSNLSYYKRRNKNLYFMMRGMMVIPGINKNHDYVKAAAKIKNVQKALLIYNIDDDLTTIAMGEKILKALNTSSEMTIFEGKHLEAISKNTSEYKLIISNFLSI